MKRLIAGNWKMNGLRETAVILARNIARRFAAEPPACEVLICPAAPLIAPVADALGASSPILLGGQDCHPDKSGAHTGDVSAIMLADLRCSHVIVGHSERRKDHRETDALVRAKADSAHAAGITAIVCVGETEAEREQGKAVEVVLGQLEGSLPERSVARNTVVAYEPVWAIGTGRTPSADDIAEMHGAIRAALARRPAGAEEVRILYGGSVNAKNAAEVLAVANVDGALVGGASLDAESFWTICRSCP